MRDGCWVIAVMLSVALFCGPVRAEAVRENSQGEQAFLKNCAVCHPNGGNIIKPEKTLARKVLAAQGILIPADIVGKMRKPDPGMTPFDAETIPDAEAKAIAEYILNTFK